MQVQKRHDAKFRFRILKSDELVVYFPTFEKTDKFYGSSLTFDPMIREMMKIDREIMPFHFDGAHGYATKNKAVEIEACIFKHLSRQGALELLP